MSRFPKVEKVLLQYIYREHNAGREWYISPSLNSTVTTVPDLTPGMGWLTALLASVSAVAGQIGTAAMTALPHVASIAGQSRQIGAANAANQQLAPQQIAIPASIAPAVVNAAESDSNGFDNRTLLFMGAIAALFLLSRK